MTHLLGAFLFIVGGCFLLRRYSGIVLRALKSGNIVGLHKGHIGRFYRRLDDTENYWSSVLMGIFFTAFGAVALAFGVGMLVKGF